MRNAKLAAYDDVLQPIAEWGTGLRPERLRREMPLEPQSRSDAHVGELPRPACRDQTGRLLPAEALVQQCRVDAFRGSGPGGQHRNKTSSAIRITHIPTGISATGMEMRSQMQNRNHALARLRRKLAIELRLAVDAAAFVRPGWLDEIPGAADLGISPGNGRFDEVLAIVLDVTHAAGASVSEAARMLNVNTAAVVAFLAADPGVWQKIAAMRKAAGLRPLGNPRK